MDDDIDSISVNAGGKPKSRIKGLSDFVLIIRDRWLLSLTVALPVALGFVYNQLQGPEYYASSSSFRLIPPPAILNLQKVEARPTCSGIGCQTPRWTKQPGIESKRYTENQRQS